MPQGDYPSGSIVFAKLKGYPWWPGEVVDDSRVPDRVLKSKPKSKGPNWTVFFFGKTREYGFFAPEFIKPFVTSEAEADLAGKKFKTKELELAVRQALDPSLIDAVENNRNAQDDPEDDEEEEQGSPMDEDAENDVAEREQTPKRKKKGSAVGVKVEIKTPAKTPAKSTQRNGKPPGISAMRKKASEEEDELAEEEEEATRSEKKSHKKRVSRDEDEDSRAKRRKSTSDENFDSSAARKPPGSPPKSNDKGSSSIDGGRDEAAARTSLERQRAKKAVDDRDLAPDEQHKLLKELRHSLQRIVYNVSQVNPEQYRRIDKTLTDVEKFEMNLSLLQWTKIGKVIKAAHKHEYPGDTFNIKQRVEKLLAAWKELLPDGDHEGRSHGSENGHRHTADERKEDVHDKTSQRKPESGGDGVKAEANAEPKVEADGMEVDHTSAEASDKPIVNSLTMVAPALENVTATDLSAEMNTATDGEPLYNPTTHHPIAKSHATEDVIMGGAEDGNPSNNG